MSALLEGIRQALVAERSGMWCGHALPHKDYNTVLGEGNYVFDCCPGRVLDSFVR